MKIFLIRHGEAIKTEKDIILTKNGVMQAKKVSNMLSSLPITRVYVSTATRAQQTFEEYHKLKLEIPFVNAPNIKEIYRTIVGGPPKEGTSPLREKEDKERIDLFINELHLLPDNENIVLFTHGNVIRYYFAKALKFDPKDLWGSLIINPGSISFIERHNNISYVKMINNIEHLSKSDKERFYHGGFINEEYFP